MSAQSIHEIKHKKTEETIHALNKIYVIEWRLSYNLFVCSESLRKLNQKESSDVLEMLSINDREHAKIILNQILHLGGTPVGNPLSPSDEPINGSFENKKLINNLISQKQILISKYKDLLEDKFEFNSKIEKILQDERNSISDLQKIINS